MPAVALEAVVEPLTPVIEVGLIVAVVGVTELITEVVPATPFKEVVANLLVLLLTFLAVTLAPAELTEVVYKLPVAPG